MYTLAILYIVRGNLRRARSFTRFQQRRSVLKRLWEGLDQTLQHGGSEALHRRHPFGVQVDPRDVRVELHHLRQLEGGLQEQEGYILATFLQHALCWFYSSYTKTFGLIRTSLRWQAFVNFILFKWLYFIWNKIPLKNKTTSVLSNMLQLLLQFLFSYAYFSYCFCSF